MLFHRALETSPLPGHEPDRGLPVERATGSYHVLFVFLGSVITATNLLTFGDLMILAMAFPNLLGVVLLSGRVRRELDGYWAALRAGRLVRYR